MAATSKNGTAKNGAAKNGAAKNGNTKTETTKKTVVAFTAAWVPPEGEQEDPNCSISGVMLLVDGAPASAPAHLVYRDYGEDDRPTWWPVLTIPERKAMSFGPDYGEEEFFQTDLHALKKLEKDAHFRVTSNTGDKQVYRIVRVEVMAG